MASFALLLAACESTPRRADCYDGGAFFCLTIQSQVERQYDLRGDAKLYFVRTAYANYYIFEGSPANVSSVHKRNMKPFKSSRVKAEYSVFYDNGYYQAYIRRPKDSQRPEMHIWTESRNNDPEEIDIILRRLRLY